MELWWKEWREERKGREGKEWQCCSRKKDIAKVSNDSNERSHDEKRTKLKEGRLDQGMVQQRTQISNN